ncbi:MAG: GNAT family N-acetyltransferase [Rhizobiaceae bacterium]
MTQGINVRAAQPGDITVIAELIHELAVYEELGNSVAFKKDDIGQALFSEFPAAEVLIGEVDGQAEGFALYFHNYSTFLGRKGLYLEDLFVRPHARGKGLGKLLLKELARIAVQRNCARMEWFVLDWNEPSIQFYKSLGANPMDGWKIFRMTDAKIRELAHG